MRSFVISAWVCSAAMSGWGQTGAGSIAGTVVGVNKKPVGTAWVTYQRELWTPASGGVYSAGFLTKSDGAFQFQGLPPGTYILCVRMAPSLGYVNTCGWTMEATRVVLTVAQSVKGVDLTVEKGMTVEFHVSDPKGLLARPEKKGRGVAFFAGLDNDLRLTNTADLSYRSQGENVYVINVPHGRKLTPRPLAPGLVLKDERGLAVGSGKLPDFVGDKNGAAKKLGFSVDDGK